MDPSVLTWVTGQDYPGASSLSAPSMPPGPVPFASESRHQADPTKSNVGRLGGVSTSSSLTGPKQVLTDKGALEQHYYHNLFSLENRPTVLNGVGHNVIPGSSQTSTGVGWGAVGMDERIGTPSTMGGGMAVHDRKTALDRMSEAVGLLQRLGHVNAGGVESHARKERVNLSVTHDNKVTMNHSTNDEMGANIHRDTAGSSTTAFLGDMEQVEISLRALAHETATLFVDAEAQRLDLHHAHEQCKQQQVHLQHLEQEKIELQDQILALEDSVQLLRTEGASLRDRNHALEQLKDASTIPKVIERLHSEMGMAEEHKKAQEEIAKLTQQLVQAQREILNWKSIADDEMKAHVEGVRERRELEAELQGLRDYCKSIWNPNTHSYSAQANNNTTAPHHLSPSSQQQQGLGGTGGGGGGSVMQRVRVETGAASLTVETCQKALVLLRPTAFTVERVTLAKHLQGIGRSFTNEPPPFPSARDSLKAFAASLSAEAMSANFLSSPVPWRQFQRKVEAATDDDDYDKAAAFLLSFVRDDYWLGSASPPDTGQSPSPSAAAAAGSGPPSLTPHLYAPGEGRAQAPPGGAAGAGSNSKGGAGRPPLPPSASQANMPHKLAANGGEGLDGNVDKIGRFGGNQREASVGQTDFAGVGQLNQFATNYSRHNSFVAMQRASLPRQTQHQGFDDLSRYITPSRSSAVSAVTDVTPAKRGATRGKAKAMHGNQAPPNDTSSQANQVCSQSFDDPAHGPISSGFFLHPDTMTPVNRHDPAPQSQSFAHLHQMQTTHDPDELCI